MINKIIFLIFSFFSISLQFNNLASELRIPASASVASTIIPEDKYEIKDYEESNKQFIFDLCIANAELLFEKFTNDLLEYVVDRTDNHKYNKYKNKSNIKILFFNNEPIGFITYFYGSNMAKACIEFLCIDTKCRAKGNATKLLNYAFEDLILNENDSVTLETYIHNKLALKIYLKAGFKIKRKTSSDIVELEKQLKNFS
ncbi:MAG: GNAT family N-acetyltransferase [Candidatus Babeliales bacterium]|nr:GNAT family N-acetyltransferase [Candidatus Babeliales bacterium]